MKAKQKWSARAKLTTAIILIIVLVWLTAFGLSLDMPSWTDGPFFLTMAIAIVMQVVVAVLALTDMLAAD